VESGAIAQFNRLHKLLLDEGVYLPPSGYEVAFISIAHGEEELWHFEKAVEKVSAELSAMV
jgi:glutamate-1-semialdehyde 2,1-aminomutase